MILHETINAGLHVTAIISLTGSLYSESFLFRRNMTEDDTRKLVLANAIHFLAILTILVTGILWLFIFKGEHNTIQYNPFFIAKLSMFTVVVLFSIYPSYTFYQWQQAAKQDRLTLINYHQHRLVIWLIRLELGSLLVIPMLVAFARADF